MKRWNATLAISLVLAAVAAFWLSGLNTTSVEPGKPYVFLSATIAVCAMILPGISGAFVLLLLGIYYPVTGLVKDLVRGHWTLDGVLTLAVFGAGCAVGLAVFSRLLRWLLQRFPNTTFAALTGLMLGCLRRLWPLQAATPETADLEYSQREWVIVSPAEWSGSLWPLIGLAVVAFGAVLLAEYWGERVPELEDEGPELEGEGPELEGEGPELEGEKKTR